MLGEEELRQMRAFVQHQCIQAFEPEVCPDIYPAVIAAMIDEHCGWNLEQIDSRTGAAGASMLLPKTAEWLAARHPDLGECQPLKFEWAIPAMVRYSRWLWEKFPYAETEEDRVCFMLSSYNGALKWMYRDRKLSIDRDRNPNVWFGHVEVVSERSRWAINVNRTYVRNVVKNHLPEYTDGWNLST